MALTPKPENDKPADEPKRPWTLSHNDRVFLKSLRIDGDAIAPKDRPPKERT